MFKLKIACDKNGLCKNKCEQENKAHTAAPLVLTKWIYLWP